jgi:hypothetical protein
MKTQIYHPLTDNEIPDGEGLTALPISFINVIARRSPKERRSNPSFEIASSG